MPSLRVCEADDRRDPRGNQATKRSAEGRRPRTTDSWIQNWLLVAGLAAARWSKVVAGGLPAYSGSGTSSTAPGFRRPASIGPVTSSCILRPASSNRKDQQPYY